MDLKSDNEKAKVFWSLMSRYCLERQAIRQIRYLPTQLEEFLAPNSPDE